MSGGTGRTLGRKKGVVGGVELDDEYAAIEIFLRANEDMFLEHVEWGG